MGRRLAWASIAALLTVAQADAGPPAAREIVNLASGLRLDVVGASPAWMQGVFLWPDNASGSQEFYLLWPTRDGSFNLMALHSNQCLMLDWRGGRSGNGTPVVQFPHCGDDRHLPALWSWGYVLDGCNPAWQQCELERRMVLIG